MPPGVGAPTCCAEACPATSAAAAPAIALNVPNRIATPFLPPLRAGARPAALYADVSVATEDFPRRAPEGNATPRAPARRRIPSRPRCRAARNGPRGFLDEPHTLLNAVSRGPAPRPVAARASRAGRPGIDPRPCPAHLPTASSPAAGAPMSDRFRPFETRLDRDRALAVLREATAGADDGELFLERRRAESLAFDDGRLRTASYDAGEGFGLRAVAGEVSGYAHSTEISEAALKRAAETARLAARAHGAEASMSAPPAATNRRLYDDVDPMEGPDFAARAGHLAELDAYARDREPKVV